MITIIMITQIIRTNNNSTGPPRPGVRQGSCGGGSREGVSGCRSYVRCESPGARNGYSETGATNKTSIRHLTSF